MRFLQIIVDYFHCDVSFFFFFLSSSFLRDFEKFWKLGIRNKRGRSKERCGTIVSFLFFFFLHLFKISQEEISRRRDRDNMVDTQGRENSYYGNGNGSGEWRRKKIHQKNIRSFGNVMSM